MAALGRAVALAEVDDVAVGSPTTCTSMWRPRSTYFSMRMVSSPKAEARLAGRGDRLLEVGLVRTMRMPLPPPPRPHEPAGPGQSLATVLHAARRVRRRRPRSRVAASLRPICVHHVGLGPTKTIPADSTARTNRAFGQEAVARMDRLGSVILAPPAARRRRYVGCSAPGPRRRPPGREGVGVGVGVHRDRADAHPRGRCGDAERDLAAVGDSGGRPGSCISHPEDAVGWGRDGSGRSPRTRGPCRGPAGVGIGSMIPSSHRPSGGVVGRALGLVLLADRRLERLLLGGARQAMLDGRQHDWPPARRP